MRARQPLRPPRSIVGKRMQSKDVANKLTDVVGNANRGDYRVQVGNAADAKLRDAVLASAHTPGSGAGRVGSALPTLPVPAPALCASLQVASSSGIQVGQWVRLFQPNSDATRRRRLLAAAGAARRRLAQAPAPLPAVPSGKVTVWGVS